MTEKNLEKRLKKEVEGLGGLCLKWVSPGFTGVPDRVCLLPTGISWFVEVKKPGGVLSERQKFVRKQLFYLGIRASAIYNDADLKVLIYEMKCKIAGGEI